tara:strand:+ start:1629 stop:3209 length:1581 start_codon:yes stop_codon:yes gene_type:complete
MKLSLLLASTLGLSLSFSAADTRPNIVTIMVDDMGYSDLGCYGSEIETPNLDKLASNGIRYTQMYNTSKCWTTRISLMSGLYHQRSDRDFSHTAMAGEVLRPAGYHTWWSGKHHANFNPYERGFDHFSGFLGGAINFWNPGDAPRKGEPDPGWKAVYTWAFDDKLINPYIPEKSFYATDTFTDWALDWLDEAATSSGAVDDPFFLYLAYNAPHWPLHAHPEDIAKYEGVYDGGYQAIREARYQRQIEMGLYDPAISPLTEPEADLAKWDSLSREEKQAESTRMAIHAGMVDRIDQNVGRFVKKLTKMGELDNTLILFLVDNGASAESPNRKGAPPEPWGSVGTFESIGQPWANAANTPLRFWKVTSHEGGINTPMIAHWPKGIASDMNGQFYREPCHLVDLLPTWMELAGDSAQLPGESTQEAIPALDGISIAPSFSGKALKRTAPLYFAYGSGRAIRDGEWKLVTRGNSPWELHDLSKGRTEANNLATQHPERVQSMEQSWLSWYQDSTGTEWIDKSQKKSTSKK